MDFTNKVVLITGAGSGIGEATALLFAKYSAKLSLVDIREEFLTKIKGECEKLNARVLTIVADLTKDKEVSTTVEDTISEFGRIDVVVNSAGIGGVGSIMDASCMELYDKIMAIDMRAIVCLTNRVVPFLIESNGCIVNISSTLAVMPTGICFAYCSAKAALSHFTRCIALELAPKGVRVNAVLPGYVRTNVLKNCGVEDSKSDEFFETIKKLSLFNRVIEAGEIAELIVYLASDKAKSITGTNNIIDAGMTLIGDRAIPK